MNNNNILKYWPLEELTPRDNQIKALKWLEKQTARYIILEAPVGSGKSLVATTFSKYLNSGDGSSFILTPQIILQKQYERDFSSLGNKFLVSLYGKSNYKCAEKNTSCSIGSIVKPKCKNCPHTRSKKSAMFANNTVLNYQLAMTSFEYTDAFKPRKLIIFDEAHTLEQHLINFDTMNISYARCKSHDIEFKTHSNIESSIKWLKEYYVPKIESTLNDMENDYAYLYDIPSTELSKQDLNKFKEVDELSDHVTSVMEMSLRKLEYIKKHFVLVHDKTVFEFKRIYGAYSFNKIFEPSAERFLFMSSTILDKKAFCKDIGINPDDTVFLSIDSDFPVENRPIYYMPVLKMNASWNKPANSNGREQLLKRVLDLLEIHKNESGVLHTANYQIAMWLVENLNGKIKHDIYHHNPNESTNRNNSIAQFMEHSEPSILISPSCTEGLDLKDDLSRFALIIKTPFGYLGDNWIKTRMEISKEWYQRRAITDIIQAGGRIVRSSDDNGTVYILDASFGYLYSQTASIIPKWWKNSYKII